MKAYSKAQKRAKRGRPTSPPVPREPSGRKSRRKASIQMQQAMTEAEARSVVVDRRIREGNIVPFRDKGGKVVTAEQQAADPRRGYVLGLMMLDGTITSRQHEAGLRYAEDEARYYGLSGIPFPSPRAQDLFTIRGSSGEESADRSEMARAARSKHMALQAVLQATGSMDEGRKANHAVREVAFLDNPYARNWPEHMRLYLRRGLNRLADHYGVAGWSAREIHRGKSARTLY